MLDPNGPPVGPHTVSDTLRVPLLAIPQMVMDGLLHLQRGQLLFDRREVVMLADMHPSPLLRYR